MLRMYKHLFLFSIALLFSLSFTARAQGVESLLHQAGNPVGGNPYGKITVVEFFDYQCGHCIAMAPVMDAIVKANPDVRIVYKDYPIRGQASEFAARAALAANKQGKYDQFSHALLVSSQPLSGDVVLQIAKENGLNVSKLKKDMDSKSVDQQLRNNLRLGETLNVSGTPAFFIGKTNAKNMNEVTATLGEMSQNELQDAINQASK